jgi:hypothetical protein
MARVNCGGPLAGWVASARGFVSTSIAEQLGDHLGRQWVLPVGDEEPGGGLVHTTLDETCPQLVV